MAKLRGLQGSIANQIIDLENRETILGRLPGCDVMFRETTVSRRHARIIHEGDGTYYAEDLGSHHGTFVNGQQINGSVRLNHLDKIQISDNLLQFMSDIEQDTDLFHEGDPGEIASTILNARELIRDDQNARSKLKALLDIIHNVGVSLDVDQVFQQILDSVFRIFPQASGGYLLIAEPPGDRLVLRASRQGDDERPTFSRTMADMVMREGRAIVTDDAGDDERFQRSESVYNFRLRSVMCAPLLGTAEKPLGMIQVDTRDPLRQFRAEDVEVLCNVANLTAKTVEHARLYATQLHFDRHTQDLKTANELQRHFLPRGRPPIENYELWDFYRAASSVGGDYFSYLQLPDQRIAIAIGDVAGKGVTAALLMARLCSDVRYALVTNPSAVEAVAWLNQHIFEEGEYGRFVTFALCILDPLEHRLEFVNAGHLPPIYRRAAQQDVTTIGERASGAPRGGAPDWTYEPMFVDLAPGDIVMMYTDGVNEALNPANKMYGTERLLEVAQGRRTAQELVEAVCEDVHQFAENESQSDDICVVAFAHRAPDAIEPAAGEQEKAEPGSRSAPPSKAKTVHPAKPRKPTRKKSNP